MSMHVVLLCLGVIAAARGFVLPRLVSPGEKAMLAVARRTYAAVLARGGDVLVASSEGNGGFPVVVIVPAAVARNRDVLASYKVHIHYHGMHSVAEVRERKEALLSTSHVLSSSRSRRRRAHLCAASWPRWTAVRPCLCFHTQPRQSQFQTGATWLTQSGRGATRRRACWGVFRM